jgi:hypothetical protein
MVRKRCGRPRRGRRSFDPSGDSRTRRLAGAGVRTPVPGATFRRRAARYSSWKSLVDQLDEFSSPGGENASAVLAERSRGARSHESRRFANAGDVGQRPADSSLRRASPLVEEHSTSACEGMPRLGVAASERSRVESSPFGGCRCALIKTASRSSAIVAIRARLLCRPERPLGQFPPHFPLEGRD